MITVVILNFNGKPFIKSTIDSVLQNTFDNYELIIVDNASTDGSDAYIEQIAHTNNKITFIKNKVNLGFAEGNNKAVQKANGDIFFFLNSDCEINKNCLKEIDDFFHLHPKAGAMQCKIKLQQDRDRIDVAGSYIDTIGICYMVGRNAIDDGKFSQIKEIFSVHGAAFAIRKETFKKLKGFDKDYFLLFEESDISWRTWLYGYKVYFNPKALTFHIRGASFANTKFNQTYLFTRNRLDSLIKNYEFKNFLKYVPLHVFVMMLFSLVSLFQFRLTVFSGITMGLLYDLVNIKRIWGKRKEIQSKRIISDNYLFMNNLIHQFSLTRSIKKFFRKKIDY